MYTVVGVRLYCLSHNQSCKCIKPEKQYKHNRAMDQLFICIESYKIKIPPIAQRDYLFTSSVLMVVVLVFFIHFNEFFCTYFFFIFFNLLLSPVKYFFCNQFTVSAVNLLFVF